MGQTPPSPPLEATGPDVVAAGAVVVRKRGSGREVLLVHRPKYDDWSFPKGKQDPGEHVTTTAVREVLEETGVEIRLGRPLLPQLYAVSGGRAKKVHYWVGHVVGDDDVSSYEPNAEVDRLGWSSLDEAAHRVTYLDDLHLLEQLREQPRSTSALVVVRHAKATKRKDWDGPDPRRPLLEVGEEQSRELSRLLAAYGVARVHTSSSTRCTQTLAPYAEEQVLPLQELDELSEELADHGAAATLLRTLAQAPESSVVCSHRPVLPTLLELLGVQEEPLAPPSWSCATTARGPWWPPSVTSPCPPCGRSPDGLAHRPPTAPLTARKAVRNALNCTFARDLRHGRRGGPPPDSPPDSPSGQAAFTWRSPAAARSVTCAS